MSVCAVIMCMKGPQQELSLSASANVCAAATPGPCGWKRPICIYNSLNAASTQRSSSCTVRMYSTGTQACRARSVKQACATLPRDVGQETRVETTRNASSDASNAIMGRSNHEPQCDARSPPTPF